MRCHVLSGEERRSALAEMCVDVGGRRSLATAGTLYRELTPKAYFLEIEVFHVKTQQISQFEYHSHET